MANKLYGIRLSSELLVDVDRVTKAEGFSSVQEFVRQAVRDAVKKHKLQQQLLALDKLAGSQPNIKRASDDELDEYVKKELWRELKTSDVLSSPIKNASKKELQKRFVKLAGSQPNQKRASKKKLEAHIKKLYGF